MANTSGDIDEPVGVGTRTADPVDVDDEGGADVVRHVALEEVCCAGGRRRTRTRTHAVREAGLHRKRLRAERDRHRRGGVGVVARSGGTLQTLDAGVALRAGGTGVALRTGRTLKTRRTLNTGVTRKASVAREASRSGNPRTGVTLATGIALGARRTGITRETRIASVTCETRVALATGIALGARRTGITRETRIASVTCETRVALATGIALGARRTGVTLRTGRSLQARCSRQAGVTLSARRTRITLGTRVTLGARRTRITLGTRVTLGARRTRITLRTGRSLQPRCSRQAGVTLRAGGARVTLHSLRAGVTLRAGGARVTLHSLRTRIALHALRAGVTLRTRVTLGTRRTRVALRTRRALQACGALLASEVEVPARRRAATAVEIRLHRHGTRCVVVTDHNALEESGVVRRIAEANSCPRAVRQRCLGRERARPYADCHGGGRGGGVARAGETRRTRVTGGAGITVRTDRPVAATVEVPINVYFGGGAACPRGGADEAGTWPTEDADDALLGSGSFDAHARMHGPRNNGLCLSRR